MPLALNAHVKRLPKTIRLIRRFEALFDSQKLSKFGLSSSIAAALPPEQTQMLTLYASALEAYRSRRWDEAEALFGQCLALWPAEGPSKLMAERCRAMRDAPPPEDWDGSFEHLTKG